MLAAVAALGAAGLLAALITQPAAGQGPGAAGPAARAPNQPLKVATEPGFGIFQRVCLQCHGKPQYKEAPSPAQLRSFSPERIYQALTSGPMQAVGAKLTDVQRRLVAQAISGRLLGSSQGGSAASMPNRCGLNPALSDPDSGPQWRGWGNGIDNRRFQPAGAAGLTPRELPALKLKWAFGLPNSTSAYSQPTVASGRVFFGADTGYVYSLDAASGCVYWSYQAASAVRNALIVEPIGGHPGTHYAVFFGDLKANVYALDAHTGKLLWTRHVVTNYTQRVTATPAYYQGKLFVPISSWEEFSAKSPDYPCCTSVGTVVALNATTGRQLWKTSVIPERPHPVGKNAAGVEQYAPAGASVWNTPAVDPKRNAIYIGTGDATTYPAADTSDSVMALDMRTGRILWHFQTARGDSFLVGCRGPQTGQSNCPKTEGPDWDIPVSPALVRLPSGQRLVVVGTKPGDVIALDPDHDGKLVWRMNVNGRLAGDRLPPGSARPSGIMWGGAVEDGNIYYGLTGGGMAAVELATGQLAWRSTLDQGAARVSNGSPATAIPGAIIVGGSDGRLLAVSPKNGRILWRFDTARSFETVNEVPAHGGGFGSQGVAVVGGMLFAGSGYAVTSAHPGNVMLAFAP